MVERRSFGQDTSEDRLLLLPGRKVAATMFGKQEQPAASGLKLSQGIIYGVGHVLNDITSAMWFSYTLLFFEVVLRMPSVVAGSLIFLGQFVDALSSPIVGILVDRYGTKKSWHMLGTTLIAFTFSLIYAACPLSPELSASVNGTQRPLTNNSWEESTTAENAISALYYSFLVSVFQLGFAIVQIAHLAIIPEMTPHTHERTDLTAIRYTFTVCSCVFVYLVTWFILHLTGGNSTSLGPKDAYKFKDVVFIGILAGGIFTMVFHALLKSTDTPKNVSEKVSEKKKVARFGEMVVYFKSFRLYQVTLVYFSCRMLLTISLVYMPLYLVENLGEETQYIAITPLVSYLSSFLASLAVRQVRFICNSKVTYLVGCLISIAACIWIGIGLEYTAELFGVSILLGAGSSVTGVASLCLCAELIGTDTENGGFIYSIVTAVDKLLGGIAVIVIEKFKEEVVVGSSHYYQDTLSYGCGIATVLGLIIILTMFFCPDDEPVKKLSKDSTESAA